MGVVEDLTSSVVGPLNLTHLPTLLVLKYSFEEEKLLVREYPSHTFDGDHYQSLKDFLEPLALPPPRNDLVFHRMAPPTSARVFHSSSTPQLAEQLDQANGWAVVSRTPHTPHRLLALKEKYGAFFEYYHLEEEGEEEVAEGETPKEVVTLFDPTVKNDFVLKDGLVFKALNKDEFVGNTTVWLKKDYVVMGVR